MVVEDTKSYNLREGDEEISLFIPIKWKEYEKDQDTGAFKSFGEREKPKGIQDVERPYFSLDFNRLIDIEKGNYSGQFTVRRVLITDDSFHFDIHISQRGGTPVVVKYSFKRVADNPDYPEKGGMRKTVPGIMFFMWAENTIHLLLSLKKQIGKSFIVPPALILIRRKSYGIFPLKPQRMIGFVILDDGLWNMKTGSFRRRENTLPGK